MIEEVAEGVENLGFGDARRLGDLQDRFAAPVERDHVADGHAQAVNHWLAAADAFEPDDVGVFGLPSRPMRLPPKKGSFFLRQCNRRRRAGTGGGEKSGIGTPCRPAASAFFPPAPGLLVPKLRLGTPSAKLRFALPRSPREGEAKQSFASTIPKQSLGTRAQVTI